MNRRQFVTGLGALAGGGGILVGTGAFTSVDADRDASVAVAAADQAYLRITPSPMTSHGAFAQTESAQEGNQLFMDFNDANANIGEGVGQSSEYDFDDVFRVENAGTQTVYVNAADVTTHGGSTLVEFYVVDDNGAQHFIDPGNNALELPVGNERAIGVHIETSAESNYSTPIQDDGDATISANATSNGTIVTAPTPPSP